MSVIARIRHLIEKNVNLVLFISIGLGFIVPGAEKVPVWMVSVILGVVIFFSCSKITLEHIREVNPVTSTWFFVIRFLVAPIIIFYAMQPLGFTVAMACTMMMLAPTGVAAPAFTGIVGGNVAFSLLLVIITHLVFIVAGPIYLSYLAGTQIPIDSVALLINLVYMVLAPALLYILFQFSVPRLVPTVKTNSTAISVMSISVIVVILVARVRHLIIADPAFVVSGLFWMGLVFAANYLLWGWLLGWQQSPDTRKAMAVSSGANNPALMIVVAALYFPPEIQVLTVVGGEIVWIFAFMGFRVFLARASRGVAPAQL